MDNSLQIRQEPKQVLFCDFLNFSLDLLQRVLESEIEWMEELRCTTIDIVVV